MWFLLSETAEHVLWTCSFARNEWALCRGKLQKCSNAATDFFSLFRLLVDKLECEELEKNKKEKNSTPKYASSARLK